LDPQLDYDPTEPDLLKSKTQKETSRAESRANVPLVYQSINGLDTIDDEEEGA